uniref:Retroviral polymerase SH3-like domain-containing protein n=1 Tax=Tanacetum cinerariifolium TaxID=118510 RepID=A0A6L2KY30_TANCI|nr:hypothetical protein [Tanacetum cinerariifolium]
MTTSVGNKSVFRSFFDKQKLTGPNFIDWYRQLRLVLSTEYKENYLEHHIPAAHVAPPGQQVPPQALAAHAAWVKGQKEVDAMYSKQAEQELLQTVREFHTSKQEEGQSVSSHVLKMKGYIDNLERLGQPVETLPKKDVNPALHAIRAGRVRKNQKNKPHKAAKGVRVKVKARWVMLLTMPHLLLNLRLIHRLRKITLQRTPFATNVVKLGIGEGTGLRESKKLKPCALSLYVGDGHCVAVEAIGTYHLELPSRLVIVLNNCHYAPSITRGVISVSKNNLVYFMAVPRDCIFEIDMSCSNTNDSSISYGYVYLLKHKHEVFETFKVFQKEVKNQLEKTIKSLRSDREVSEMRNRTLLDMVRSMMSQTTLPKSFWDYALETAARILNMVPTKKVDKTPYEIWHGQAPKLSYLKVWGCEAFVKRDTLIKPDKLEPRSFKCIFVGYPKKTMGYSFYSPSENKVFVARNDEFFESKLLDLKASGSVEDLELIQQEEDVNPSLDTSLNHEEDDQKINEPKSDINPIHVKSYLGRMFAMKDLGEATYILRIKIRDRSKRLIGLCQKAYIEKILKRFYMENSKRGTIPMQEKLKLSKSQGALTPAEKQRMQNILYASDGGYIMYAVRCTHPDVAFAQNMTSRFQQNPGEEHWPAGGNMERKLRVSCYTDAGYLTDADNLKSQTGYVFVLNGGAVDWKSTKQSIFATSSTDAEYIAAFDASKKAVWIPIAKDDGVAKGARHFRAKVHYLRETIKLDDVKIEKIDTYNNLADPFTKTLAFPKHSELTRNIGLLPASSFM